MTDGGVMTDPANGGMGEDGDDAPPPTVIDPGRQPAAPPPTTMDPGRGPGPADPPGPPVTVVDPGRRLTAVPPPPLTAVDPGRVAPAADSRPPSQVGLPAPLADRFTVVRELARGGQADLYLVTEKATGRQRAVKVYAENYRPDARVWTYLLTARTSPSVVEVFEADVVDGRCYEVMEFLAGDDLWTLRGTQALTELGAGAVDTIIGQIVDALEELHANGIVHRDIKPTNIRLRSLDPPQAVVLDLGISTAVDGGEKLDDNSGTTRYAAPEFLIANWVAPSNDWWALGISLIEFFTGNEVMPELNDTQIRLRIGRAPMTTSAVADPRRRLLCEGLTVRYERERWGADKVRRWLAGESPPVPTYQVPESGRPGAAKVPFRYLDVEYRFPDELAAAMTSTWELAAVWLHGGDAEPRKRLREWADQFPDVTGISGKLSRRSLLAILTGTDSGPRDARLLRTLRALDPTAPPIYRNHNITRALLPELAREAIEGEGTSPAVVDELWRYPDLLRLLAVGARTDELGGGDGLLEIQQQWRVERERLDRQAGSLPAAARDAFEGLEREAPVRLLGIALLAATTNTEQWDSVVDKVQRCAIEVREADVDVDWFVDLAEDRSAQWLAYALVPFARRTRDDQLRAAAREQAEREWLRRTQSLREWSRRQNRPQGLAWGVAGVAALAAITALLIVVSDAVGFVSGATILNAWVVSIAALMVVLTVESLLAWQIGGDVHPSYTIIGAGVIALGRRARAALGRRIALAVVLGVLGGPVVIGIFAPVAVPLVGAAGVVGWAWLRYLRWQADRARDQERLEQAEQDRQAART